MRSLIAIWFLCTPLILFGQNPELDSLRHKTKQSPKIRMFQCELCEAFARYSMPDSAEHCLAQARLKPTSSYEVNICWQLTEAQIAEITSDMDAALLHYDTAFQIIRTNQPSFRVAKKAYLQAMSSYAYFARCARGLPLVDEFIELVKKEGNDSLLMETFMYKAEFLICLSRSDSAYVTWLQKADSIAHRNPRLLGAYYDHKALYHYFIDELPQSVEYCLLAENAYKGIQDTKHLPELYHTFATIYEEIADFQRAKEYLFKAKPGMVRADDHRLNDFFNTLGWVYYRNGEIDSALHIIQTSVERFERFTPGNPNIAYPIGNLGLIYKEIGKPDSASYYSKQAAILFRALNHPTGEAEAYNNLGFIALEPGRIREATGLFQKALGLLEGTYDHYEQMKSLNGLYQSTRELNPSAAIGYFERYADLRIAFMSKEEAVKASRLEAEFYQKRNEDHIRQLQYESQVKSLEIEQQNNRILFTSLALVVMLIIAALIFFYWLQRKKLMRSLEESNEINQRIISMISHDFRGPLNNVKLTLELLQAEDMDMHEFAILSKDLYRQSADLALMFDSFVGWAIAQRKGYVPSRVPFKWSDVVEEVISISQPLAKLKDVKIQLKAHSQVQAVTDRMAASLILRNLLSNAIKYSHKGSSIYIEYHQDKGVVHTKISDQGVGMSAEKLEKILTTGDGSALGTNNEYGVGLGLRMVIKYVKGIRGTIKAESQVDAGTTFTVSIPLRLEG